jgi:hypothetical protein
MNDRYIVLNTERMLIDYRDAIIPALYQAGYSTQFTQQDIKAVLEESVRQVFDIIDKDFAIFTSRFINRPNFHTLSGRWDAHNLTIPLKVSIENLWKDLALNIYFTLVQQLNFVSSEKLRATLVSTQNNQFEEEVIEQLPHNDIEFIVTHILMDGLVLKIGVNDYGGI